MPDVLMPRLSDTMQEGVLSRWLKSEGDFVHRGDILAEIETDKATMELEAYDDGVLERLLVAEGTTVPIGAPIAVIGDGMTSGTATPGTPAPDASPVRAPSPSPTSAPTAQRSPTAADQPGSPPSASPRAAGSPSGELRTSPLARRIARDHGLDLAKVHGTGPAGRIVRVDVQSAIDAVEKPASATTRDNATAPAAASATQRAVLPGAGDDDDEVPLSNIRRITARRLTESAAAPHFYLTDIVDAVQLLAFRKDINERLSDGGTKISLNDLLVRACAVALRMHPAVNASWASDKILRHRRINVGVAVAIDDGLVVPVIRDTDRMSLGEIALETRALADRARAGRLAPEDFTGGTFTISNLGMFGIDHFTAVINPPEAAILAVGAATDEAVVRDGVVVVRTTIKVTLSVDHRVLDGASAAAFLRDLRSICEEPLRIVV